MSLRCGVCNKFSNSLPDSYVDFGRTGDTEPPDPVEMCEKCSEEIKTKIASMRRPQTPYIPWSFSKAHRKGVELAGMVLAGPPKASWCCAYWPEDVPINYEVWS